MCVLGMVAIGCGSSDPGPDADTLKPCREMGGSACFQLPTAPVSTRDGAPSALGCGYTPKLAPSPVTFSGTVKAFGTSKPIPSATVKLYGSSDYMTPIATTTSNATDGTYSITVPAGTDSRLYGELSAANFLTIFPEDVRSDLTHGNYDMYTLQMITSDALEGAALLVKEIWDPEAAVFAGTALDCNGLIIMHAAITVSTVSGQRMFAPSAAVYYGAPGAAPLAVPPDDRGDTNDNGAFALFHLKAGTQLYAQMWGFVDEAARAQGEAGLTLLAEHPLHVVPNTAGNVSLWAH